MFFRLKHLILKIFGYFFWYFPFFALVMTYSFVHRHYFSNGHIQDSLPTLSADMRYIGDLLYENRLPSHREMAAQWYERASHAGDAESEFRLGKMMMFGDGVPADPGQGIEWIRLSAEHGNPDAKNFLDHCLNDDNSYNPSCSGPSI